jgi:hypothetical protein
MCRAIVQRGKGAERAGNPSATIPALVSRRASRGTTYPSMKNLELSDAEAEALARELAWVVDGDRYPLSPRIQTLRVVLARLRPEPARTPLPPLKTYEPPSRGRYRRRSG